MKENKAKETNKAKVEETNKDKELIEKLTSDVEHWKNEYYRAYADMKNLREAVEKDHRNALKYRAEGFIENLLPILDGFHMALQCKASSQEMQNFLTGFEFIYRNMVSVLENEGVSEISPKIDEEFNPNTMSAIETIEDEGKPNRVLKVNVCGYKLHDRLIRPSIVVVSTSKKDEKQNSETKEESPKMDA